MAAGRGLVGRDNECHALRDLVSDVRSGRSRVLVLRGQAGVGKSALLEFLVKRADGCRVSRAVGVEGEMELPFAGLHQLCFPFMNRLDGLPPPQREALATTFGLEAGNPPDLFLVGLAVLTLITDAGERQPVLCVVDDAQWLDQASAQIMEFVSRRLEAERVGMLFALRGSDEVPKFAGLPELSVHGLRIADAATLLDSAVPGRLDPEVRDRVLTESQGNPLALLELPRALTSTELTFGSHRGPATATALMSRLHEGFSRQVAALPGPCRQLLVLAAAEPVGDLPLLWRAAERSGIRRDAVEAAEAAGLLELGARVRFRHPLVRSAVYRAASPDERRRAHQALADATNPSEDPDRRAWHRARAAVAPDEDVAAELQRSADRAFGRGGVAAAAACLEAAAALTPDPARRARRSLEAAQAKATAGAFDDASALLAAAEAEVLDEAQSVGVLLLRAQMELNAHHGNQGLPMLLAAARRLQAIDPEATRATYLDAMTAAMFAGRLARGSGVGMQQVARAVREARLPLAPGRPDMLLRGLSVLHTEGYAEAAARLRTTVHAFSTDELTVSEAVRFAWLAACVATDIWDDFGFDVLTSRHLNAIRDIGALSVLPVALNSRVLYLLLAGEVTEAESLVTEAAWVAEVTAGQNAMLPYGEICLSAMRGDAGRAEPQINELLSDIEIRGEGVGLNVVGWCQSMLYNGWGRYPEAVRAARLGAAEPLELGSPKWALQELVEAGVRSGEKIVAAAALEQLTAFTQASGTELALGVEAVHGALLRSGEGAEDGYREGIERLDRTRMQVQRARARLLYGEWLRREGRRTDARTQLRTAYEALVRMGVHGFAERARLELNGTGDTVQQRSARTTPGLTAQEARIARLAADGLTNHEIGATLYIGAKTVEWHLRKVFAKLGIASRRQLPDALLAHLAQSTA